MYAAHLGAHSSLMAAKGQIRQGDPATVAKIAEIMALSAEDAARRLEILRWPPDGIPVCPRCHSETSYRIRGLRLATWVYRCGECRKDFSAMSDTALHHNKLDARVYLAAVEAAADATLSRRQFAALTNIQQCSGYKLIGKITGRPARCGRQEEAGA